MIFVALVGAAIAALAAYGGTGWVRRWAERGQLLDIPNERSSHARPMPRGGGLAIASTVLVGTVLWALQQPPGTWLPTLAYVAGAGAVAGVSYWDDRHSLSYRVRLAVHFGAAVVAMLGFGFSQALIVPLAGRVEVGWLGLPLTLVWIVGLTNAYNFIDGIDGLAGLLAVIGGMAWASSALAGAPGLASVLGLLVAAGSLGFLGHNWPPARIFMGDVGSAFLGFTFAVLPLIAGTADARWFLAGPIILWPLIFDTGFTFFRRLIHHENVFAAHRTHLYQRLVIAGYPHRAVTILYGALTALTSLAALAWVLQAPGGPLAVLVVLLLVPAALCILVSREERNHAVLRGRIQASPPVPTDGSREGVGLVEP